MKRILLFGFVFLAFACEDVFMHPTPETTPIAIYNEYWKVVSEKFVMFDDPTKKIDKPALHKRTRAKIKSDMSDDDLFKVLGEIALALKDTHSFIKNTGTDMVKVYWPSSPIKNYDDLVIQSIYLNGANSVGQNITNDAKKVLSYKRLSEVGYIRIKTFEDIKLTSAMIDEVLTAFQSTKGIIFDLRGNAGGAANISTMIPAHFTTKKIFAGTERIKSGPGENDFKDSKMYLIPKGVQYNKPVVILMDIGCYSATSRLISCFRAIRKNLGSKIFFMGSKTGGGTGNAIHGYLANGWIWSVSTTEFIEPDGGRYDHGLPPDEEIWDDKTTTDKDEVIERAIQKINSW